MQINKPEPVTTYVTVTDRATRKSKHITVYNATVEDVIQRLRDASSADTEDADAPQASDSDHPSSSTTPNPAA